MSKEINQTVYECAPRTKSIRKPVWYDIYDKAMLEYSQEWDSRAVDFMHSVQWDKFETTDVTAPPIKL